MVELLSHSLSRMFHNISDSIEETKDQLSALDGAIGDADHGVTMSIGFQAVKAELSRRNVDAMAPAELMNTAAMAFLNSVGASTGPLYATGLRRAAQALAGAARRDAGNPGRDRQGNRRRRARARQGTARRQDDARRLDSGGGGRRRRGPPVGERRDRCGGKSSPPPRRARTSTRSMVASKGRAARLGERALGHVDPGATSAVVILKAMALTFCENGAGMSKSAGAQDAARPRRGYADRD